MSNLLKKLDNYWYHYKWPTLIALFFGIFCIIGIVQMTTKDKIDVNILYTGPYVFSPREVGEVEAAFEAVMSKDYNGDGEMGAEFTNIVLLTDDQVREVRQNAKTGSNSADAIDNVVIDGNGLREAENSFNQQIFAGEVVICLLDPYWYNEVKAAAGFVKLSDVLGSKPDYAIDDYGVLLSDTNFAQYFKVFARLPEDTVLCMRTISTISIFTGREKTEEKWNWNAEMMRDLFAFEFPEGYDPEALEIDEAQTETE